MPDRTTQLRQVAAAQREWRQLCSRLEAMERQGCFGGAKYRRIGQLFMRKQSRFWRLLRAYETIDIEQELNYNPITTELHGHWPLHP